MCSCATTTPAPERHCHCHCHRYHCRRCHCRRFHYHFNCRRKWQWKRRQGTGQKPEPEPVRNLPECSCKCKSRSFQIATDVQTNLQGSMTANLLPPVYQHALERNPCFLIRLTCFRLDLHILTSLHILRRRTKSPNSSMRVQLTALIVVIALIAYTEGRKPCPSPSANQSHSELVGCIVAQMLRIENAVWSPPVT